MIRISQTFNIGTDTGMGDEIIFIMNHSRNFAMSCLHLSQWECYSNITKNPITIFGWVAGGFRDGVKVLYRD